MPFLCAAIALFSAHADHASAAQSIDAHFVEREKAGFSGVLFIAHDGKTLLNKAYGERDREGRAPMTVSHGFDIGSITKPITRAAILKLEAEGQLSLEDVIGKYFPETPEDKKGITIRHLLTHRSGLPDTFGGDYQVVDREWIVGRALRSTLLQPPGEKSQYSNSGYSLLAAIIENVTKMPYECYVGRAIFEPVEAKRIGYLRGNWKPEELAVGYRRGGQRWGTPLDHAWAKDGPGWNLRGNGGMISDVAELHRVFQGIVYGETLPSEARQAFLPVREGRPRFYSAAGGNGIFNALYVLLAEPNFVFIGFSNRSDHQVEDSEEFLQKIFQDLMRKSGL
jgi:CubicO group peptidase (beta-lactamase class C family)